MIGKPVRAVMFRVDVSGHPAKFTVTSVYRTPPPPVEVDVDGPSKVRLTQRDTAEGFEFTYIVSAEGEYAVRILCDDRVHILGSPFQATFNCKSTVFAFVKTVLYYCVMYGTSYVIQQQQQQQQQHSVARGCRGCRCTPEGDEKCLGIFLK